MNPLTFLCDAITCGLTKEIPSLLETQTDYKCACVRRVTFARCSHRLTATYIRIVLSNAQVAIKRIRCRWSAETAKQKLPCRVQYKWLNKRMSNA